MRHYEANMKEILKQEKDYPVFADAFLFRNVNEELIRSVYQNKNCICGQFEAGESVYTKKHFQKSMGIVLFGELKACKSSSEGSSLLMNTFFKGCGFGVASLFTDRKEYVSEVSAVKSSRILFIPQAVLKELLHGNMQIVENYIAYLSDRICFLNGRIDNFTGGTAEKRLAGFLLSLSAHSADPCKFTLPFTLMELSSRLDVGRASLYRAFDALEEAGVLIRESKKITIKEMERLKNGQY